MKIIKKIILIYISLSMTFSQDFSVDWLLSDTRNFNKLPDDTKTEILEKSNKIIQRFQSDFIRTFNLIEIKTFENCRTRTDKNIAQQYYDLGASVSEATFLATGEFCDEKVSSGFKISNSKQRYEKSYPKINIKRKEKSLSYQNILDMYDYDYLFLAEKGINENNIDQFAISEVFADYIELKDNYFFSISSLWVKGKIGSKWSESDNISDLLKMHDIDSRETVYDGTYVLPNFTIFDIYRMDKYYNISLQRNTKYKGPKVEFILDKSKQSFEIPVWKINDGQFAKLSEKYSSAIKMLVKDITKEIVESKKAEKKRIETEFNSRFDLIMSYAKISNVLTKNFMLNPSKENINMLNNYIDNHHKVLYLYQNQDFLRSQDSNFNFIFNAEDYVNVMNDIVKNNSYPLKTKRDNYYFQYAKFCKDQMYLDVFQDMFGGKKANLEGIGFNNFANSLFIKLASSDLRERNKIINKYKDKFSNVEKGKDKILGGYSGLMVTWNVYFHSDETNSPKKVANKYNSIFRLKSIDYANEI